MDFSLKQLRDYQVPTGSLVVWWLGQAGFIIKSPQGVLTVMDPYLSDSCGLAAETIGANFHRVFPPPISPADLGGVDLYILTHSHQDHLDPETLQTYREAGGNGPFLAPAETNLKLQSLGVPQSEIVPMWPNKVFTIRDISFRATLAIPFGGDDLTHVGYLISIQNGPTFYFTGDTAYHEVLGICIAEHKPDVMFTVINGMWRNLGPAEAAQLAHRIQPKVVIPYHYDLFPDGQMPPHTLRLNLFLYQLHDRFRVLEVGRPWFYP
jgi:L-ascorbate 6-phosphate lactonase